MPNPVAVNDLSPISGSLQTSRISYAVETAGKDYGQDYNGTTWYSDIPQNGSQYTIISDNYTANYYVSRSNAEGAYVEGGLPAVDEYSAPVFWLTAGTSSLDIITIVNGLPDRRGQIPFNSGSQALNWVASSSNYFAVGPPYEQTDTDQMLFYVNASQVISYPTTQSTWYDISGNNSNVSLQNTPSWDSSGWFSGDGVDDKFVVSPTAINYSRTALTVEAFVYYNATFSGYKGGIMSKWQTGAGSNNEWSLSSENISPAGTGPGLLGFGLQYTSAGIQGINGTTVMVPQKWYHCVGTYDGSNLRVYVNGVLENTAAALASSYKEYASQPTALLGFGNGLVGGPDYYPTNARLSEARIYNKALSTSDVAQNYYGGPIVTDGLVFAIDAGNLVSYPKSGTSVYNLTGSGATGTLTNGVGFSNVYDGTWVFDGTDDYIVTDVGTPNITSKTLEAWVSLSNVTQQGGGVINLQYDGGGIFDSIVYNETGQGWGFGSEGFNRTAWSGVVETVPNQWIHIVATYENNNFRMYRNSVLILTTTSFLALNYNTNSESLLGLRHNGASNGYLNASIAVGRIYSRALTAAEVLQNYNATK
jgi:hypothetical protein